jgi:uncharacterized protein (DUF1330 family)
MPKMRVPKNTIPDLRLRSSAKVGSMIYLTQLVYVRKGCETEFKQFENIVLPLLSKYRGELLLRIRPEHASKIGGSSELPFEVHVVRFETEEDLAAYSNDEERQRSLHLKEQSVRSAILIKGTLQ